jgi:oxalate decarboxylase
MGLSHHFRFSSSSVHVFRDYGKRTDITQQNFPVLKGMAISFLELNPKAFREPHWHPNANELSYCLEGEGVITVFTPNAGHETFLIEAGTMSFVPIGYIHSITNIGDKPLKMLVCFDHEKPEDLNLSSSVAVMPKKAMGSTVSQNAAFFAGLNCSIEPIFIGKQISLPTLQDSWQTNPYKYNFEKVNPQIKNDGGWVKLSNSRLLPTLNGIALYVLQLEHHGIREPHWHPNAHELNFLIEGQVRITLLSPGGEVDTFDMQAGDISFLPKGYIHYIENIGSAPALLAVFFSNSDPSDIGISGCLGAYSNEMLSALFNVSANYFDHMQKFQADRFIVSGGG